MRVTAGFPRSPFLSLFILAAILWICRQLDICAFGRAEEEFWFETTAAFSAVSIHLVVDKNLIHLKKQIRRFFKRPPK